MKALEDDTFTSTNKNNQLNNLNQIKTAISSKIIQFIDDRNISTREAHALTKVSPADFSRIRNKDLDRFTIDRLVRILNMLDRHIEVMVGFKNKAKNPQKIKQGLRMNKKIR